MNERWNKWNKCRWLKSVMKNEEWRMRNEEWKVRGRMWFKVYDQQFIATRNNCISCLLFNSESVNSLFKLFSFHISWLHTILLTGNIGNKFNYYNRLIIPMWFILNPHFVFREHYHNTQSEALMQNQCEFCKKN